jgi:hypothetical protein
MPEKLYILSLPDPTLRLTPDKITRGQVVAFGLVLSLVCPSAADHAHGNRSGAIGPSAELQAVGGDPNLGNQ